MTVIVKTTHRIEMTENGARLAIAPPKPLVREDVHLRGNPVASLAHASEFALALPRCEILVVGRACARRGTRTTRMTVALSLHRGGKPVLEKSIDVTGNRRGTPSAQDEPEAFEEVPIIYERSMGGMLSRENPVGMGMEAGADGRFDVPNLAFGRQSPFAMHPGQAAAGFGPLPSVWPLRAHRRGSVGRAQATSGDWLNLPRDFDTRYFQCAPRDQQLDALTPRDVITLEGMSSEHPRLSFELPERCPSAIVEAPNGERTPVDLRMDTLHIEPEHLSVEIVFRGTIPLRAQETSGWRVGGALSEGARPFAFPSFDAPKTTRLSQVPRAEAQFASTVVLEPEDDEKAPVAIRPPSPLGSPNAPVEEMATALVGDGIARPPVESPSAEAARGGHSTESGERAPRLETTMVLEPSSEAPPERRATMLLEQSAAPTSLPFDRQGTRTQEPAPRSAPPGAPWAKGGRAKAAPEPTGFHSTLVIPPPTEPPTPDLQPEPPKPKRSSPWREDPIEPPLPPAAKPAPPPRADLKSQLYRKLKK